MDLRSTHLGFWALLVWFVTLYALPYPPVIGGVSMESCSACPAGHYCSIEGLANPIGPCAAGFYCPFDFSSTTPYAFLCPKVRVYSTFLNLFCLFHWILFPVLPFSIILIVFQTVSVLGRLVPCCLLLISCCSECHHQMCLCLLHSLLGPLLSRRLCPGPALSHRRVPAESRLRKLHPMPTWILLWGGYSGGAMALPTTLILPCRYSKGTVLITYDGNLNLIFVFTITKHAKKD